MDWSELEAVAAEVPPRYGTVVSHPFVRDSENRVFKISDVDAEDPAPTDFLTAEDVERRIESGAWIRVPPWPARRGCLVIVQSYAFARALDIVGQRDDDRDMVWPPLAGNTRGTYVSREAMADWESRCVAAFMAWTDRELRYHARWSLPSLPSDSLKVAEDVLSQAVFVTRRRSPERRMIYQRLGIVMQLLDPSGLSVVTELASREFDVEEAAFYREIEDASRELGLAADHILYASPRPLSIFTREEVAATSRPITSIPLLITA